MPVLHKTQVSEPGLLGQTALSRLQSVIVRTPFGTYYRPCRKCDQVLATPARRAQAMRVVCEAVPASLDVETLGDQNRSATQSGFYVPKYRTQTGGGHRKYS